MKLLAIETSSTACSVALSVDDSIAEAHVVEPRAHTRVLVPMISQLLTDAKLEPNALDAVALGNGPGSFIGMRIGASVAQGICFGGGLKIIPVSSLAAVAAESMTEGDAERVVVTQDARMNEVYVGIFRRGDDGQPVPEGDEYIDSIDRLEIKGGPFITAGDGWHRYPELLTRGLGDIVGQSEIRFPRARFILPLAKTACDTAIPADELVPSYLRHKVAEPPGDAGTGSAPEIVR